MNISGDVKLNKKKYGKYLPHKKVERVSFAKKNIKPGQNPQEQEHEELIGINDLDVNMINPDNIASKPLQLEIQLSNSETKLEKLKKEIKDNQMLGVNESTRGKKLHEAHQKVTKDIEAYRMQYRELGLSYKIADTTSRVKVSVLKAVAVITQKVMQVPAVKDVLAKVPSYRQREKLSMAQALSKKISAEMASQKSPDPEEVEVLLVKAEKFVRQKQDKF